METELLNMIGSLGFPIVCCGYLITKFENTLKENTRVINNLSTTITVLLDTIEKKEQSKKNKYE